MLTPSLHGCVVKSRSGTIKIDVIGSRLLSKLFLFVSLLREIPREVQSSLFSLLSRPRTRPSDEDAGQSEYRHSEIPANTSDQHGQVVTHISSGSLTYIPAVQVFWASKELILTPKLRKMSQSHSFMFCLRHKDTLRRLRALEIQPLLPEEQPKNATTNCRSGKVLFIVKRTLFDCVIEFIPWMYFLYMV